MTRAEAISQSYMLHQAQQEAQLKWLLVGFLVVVALFLVGYLATRVKQRPKRW